MADADLQRAVRRLRRLEELTEDQRRRVLFFRRRGDAKSTERAIAVLAIFEQCLVSARYMVAEQRRNRGVQE